MNILKLKRIFYLFITLAVVGVLVTSCEKEIIIEDDLDGLKTSIVEDEDAIDVKQDETVLPPLTMEELDELFIKNPELFTENESFKTAGNCGCSRLTTTYRNPTSRYVYCHNWSKNNSWGNALYCAWGSGYSVSKLEDYYYEVMTGLTPGNNYQYNVIYRCTSGNLYVSPNVSWTQ